MSCFWRIPVVKRAQVDVQNPLPTDLAQWQSKEKRVRNLLLMTTFLGWGVEISLRRSEVGKILIFTRDQRVGFQARSPPVGIYPSQCVRQEPGWTRETSTSNRCEVIVGDD